MLINKSKFCKSFRFTWIYTEIQNKHVKLYDKAGSHLPIVIKAINIQKQDWNSKKHILNDKYENFVTGHIEAAAATYIPTKLKAKSRILWEPIAVRERWDNMKKASLLNKRNPTNTHKQKLKKAQGELTKKKQLEYIQSQINKIKTSVENKQED